MAKRKSKKTATQRRKKVTKSAKSDSTVSLSGRHAYRWRYLQLIKEGLVWLTGKRTRGARMSESAIAASKKSSKRRSQRKATRTASLRFKVVRGMFEDGGKKKKKHAGNRAALRKRGSKGMRMYGNGGLKRGRKPTRGRPKKPQKSDSESTYETVIYSPKRHSYARNGKFRGSKAKSRSRQGTSKSGRGQGARKSTTKRGRATKTARLSKGSRADGIVTRSVSGKVHPRSQSPKKTASPGKRPVKMIIPGKNNMQMDSPSRAASVSTIFV